jgi:hypothetical protein
MKAVLNKRWVRVSRKEAVSDWNPLIAMGD